MKRSFHLRASVCLLFCVVSERGIAQAPANTTVERVTDTAITFVPAAARDADRRSRYYVDCSISERNGDGHSPATAWPGLDAVNQHVFAPGDVIYLRRGTECHGLLWPKGSGLAAAVIRLSAYGTGPRPKVMGGESEEEAFRLFEQEYWDVDSIDFAGGTRFGVFISGDKGILHHIHLKNLLVHDVHGGEVKHKESGLVVISPGKVEQHFDDVLVEQVTAYRTEQWAGILVGGGNFGEVSEENWNTHVVVRNSVVHDVFGDGIILFRVRDGLIDTSAAWHTGMQPTQSIGTPNAIWTWMCQDCVVRRCEAFLTDSPGVDGGAFDIDYGNTRNSVLDNFGHDTQGYCIAVFGAGYVTRESVVEGNLCIDNGKSPRLARYQGAIFLWTWNGGVIENLRVAKNTIYWRPPGEFAAVLNRADIQGTERTFRENQIYSDSPAVVDSNKQMSFRDNQYTTCGPRGARWIFDRHTYSSWEEFRAATGQEPGSNWKSEKEASFCSSAGQPQVEKHTSNALTNENASSKQSKSASSWTVTCELPVSIDAQGLVDTRAAGQLLVLKNIHRQFRATGLQMAITLEFKQTSAGEAVQTVIRDLGMNDVKISEPLGGEVLTRPKTRLVAPDGSIAREWQDFIGPAEIGLALRSTLGVPWYSPMELEDASTER